MPFKGWEVEVYRGESQTDSATGDGSTTDYNLSETVITEEPSRATPIELKVYIDSVLQSSGYTFVPGTPDKISFSVAPSSGAVLQFKYFKEVLVGNARELTYDIVRNLKDIIGVGSYKPQYIKELGAEYTGSIEHFMTDSQFWDAVDPAQQFLPEFVIQAKVGKPTATKKVNFIGVKFESLGGSHPQDDFATESLDFRARDAKFTEA